MGSDPVFTTRIELRDGLARIALRGELDAASVPILNELLASLEHSDVAAVMLNLRGLTFIDSTGLHAFLQASAQAKANGYRLILVGASARTRVLFELTGTLYLLEDGDVAADVAPARAPPVRSSDRSFTHRRSGPGGTNGAASEEAALVRAFFQRDPEAATVLYRRVEPSIRRLGALLLRDDAKAQQLVETTMIHVWRRAKTFDPQAISLDAWVRSIARDLVVAGIADTYAHDGPRGAIGISRARAFPG